VDFFEVGAGGTWLAGKCHQQFISAAGALVNRWPHGYAWNPNALSDQEFEDGEAPHEVARQPFGQIRIANSDAGARAYLDCAIDEAWRAVSEFD